jgi:hypothetical protein
MSGVNINGMLFNHAVQQNLMHAVLHITPKEEVQW